MACFVYEATLLFGIALIPGVLGALFVAQTGQQHPLQSETALRLFALVLYGVYFVWLWSARGQTLAMQTWRIRLVTAAGGAPVAGAGAGALRRLLLRLVRAGDDRRRRACTWRRGRASAAVAFGIVALRAAQRSLAPERQFWHDRCAERASSTCASEPARRRSDGVLVELAGADPHDVLDLRDEDLAVADLAGLGGLDDRVDAALGLASLTTTSIFTLGRKSTTYSAPR